MVKTQKWYFLYIMRSAYFLSKGDYIRRQRERERARERERQRE